MNVLLATTMVLVFCSLVQGAAGFAFGLFAVPLLLLSGLDLPRAVAISALASLLQRIAMLVHLRRAIAWRGLAVVGGCALAALPLGVWALRELGTAGSRMVKPVLGGLVLLVLGVRLLARIAPRERLHWFWGAFAGAWAGFLQGLASVGGPPIVLWSLAHRWPPERLRTSTPFLITLLSPFQLVMLHLAFGPTVWPTAGSAVVLVPAVWIATAAGVWLGGRLRVERLRVFITLLLALLAAVLIFDPLAGWRS